VVRRVRKRRVLERRRRGSGDFGDGGESL